MEENEKAPEERQIIKIEETSLEEIQLAEQLYNSAGLDPVVDAGLKDYDKRIQLENKLISKVLGPRGSDMRWTPSLGQDRGNIKVGFHYPQGVWR